MKTPIFRSTLLAAMLAALSTSAGAAGLGRINVFSALGQPLRAEVEIAATAEELESMSARLATPEAFKRANIEYSGELSGLRMNIERRSGSVAILRVSSDRPFNEPFVDMLIELNWAGGRLLREYTFLLDPAETPAQRSAPSVAQPVVRPDTSISQQTLPPAARPEPARPSAAPTAAPAAPSAAKPAAPAVAPGEDYTVQKGDTLSSIASAVKTDSVTQDQMLAALYQANSDAFVGGNINRLRAGRILKVPEAEEAERIGRREARQIIVQASNFSNFRKSVAAAAAAAPAQEPSATQSSSGKITPKVEEPTPATAPSKDQLKISKTQVAKTGEAPANQAAGARVQALEEDIAAREKALKEANSRVADLERNVKELQKLVELKNQNLAELQKQASAADAAAKDAARRAEDAAKVAAAAKTAAPAAVAAPVAASAPAVAPAPAPVEPVVEAPAAATQSEPMAAEESAAVATEPAQQAEPAPATQPRETEVTEVIAPAPVEEPGLLDSLLSNWIALVASAAAIAGLVLVALRNRKRTSKNDGLTTSAMSEMSTSPNSVFGNAGGQTVDTGTSVLHTDFSQSGLSAIDTDEGVDPVAEADVYMAYGRDAQAEEILLDALKSDPSRAAIYVKLLEIYSQRRSVKQFENVATDLFTQTGGAGDDWAKAAALGARLDPTNPLYRSAATDSSSVAAPVTAAATGVAAAAMSTTAPAVAASAPQLPVEDEVPEAVTFGTNNVSQMRATWTVPGELNQFTGSGENDLTIPALDNTPDVSVEPEPLNLDFNLDLEIAEGEEPQTEMETRDEPMPLVVEPVGAQDEPLEFDIDALAETSPEPIQEIAARQPEPVREQKLTTPEAAAQAASRAPQEDTLPEDVDLGIERALERTTLAVVDLEKTNFEGNLLDFDFELGDEPKQQADDRSLDLSNMNLRTDGQAATATGGVGAPPVAPVPASAPASALGADEQIPESIDVDDEVSTKLELARAYEEMGDLEGARELLEEVVADGADTQRQTAQGMLQRIASVA